MRTRLLAALVLLASPLAVADRGEVDPALLDRDWLRKVIRYAYCAYLDDAFFAATQADAAVEVWVRGVEPRRRDEEDRSRFAELWLPKARVLLGLKQADYTIPELGLPVKSAGYRVIHGSCEEAAPGDAASWRRIEFDRVALFEELRATRAHQPLGCVSAARRRS